MFPKELVGLPCKEKLILRLN